MSIVHLPRSSTLEMVEIHSSETMVTISETTEGHIQMDSHLHSQDSENWYLTSLKFDLDMKNLPPPF
jgi:hypothetical protein